MNIQHRVWLSALICACLSAPSWGAARPQVKLDCASHGQGPQLSCTVRVQDAHGAPIQGAQVQLSALMPSMAMAHTIQPAIAKATGRAGEYQGTLTLEMLGIWTVAIDLRGPVRDKLMHNVMVKPCASGLRCSAMVVQDGCAPESTDHAHMKHKP